MAKYPCVLGIRMTKSDMRKIERASALDHRNVADFVRHYILITSEAIISVGAQRDFLGILGNKKVMAKVVKELSK